MRRKHLCDSNTRVTASLLLGFLAVSSASQIPILPPPPISPDSPPQAQVHEFSLKHIFHHGTYLHPDLHRRLDVPENAAVWMAEDAHSSDRERVPPLRIRSEPMNIQRLVDRSKETIDGILDWGRSKGRSVQLAEDAWTTDEIPGPNVTDKETVLTFARMAANAYIMEPGTGEWQDVKGGFNYTEDFGWESDGLRGHVFADTTNRTVVIGLKGTSPAVFDGSETTTNDKINDNLFFSCCCGQGGQYLWRQVCDCQTSAYTCNSTCLVTALNKKNRYYYAARDLYHNVTELYPDAEVWMAGHSLGGAVSSFLGLTYGHPALTFEAVPEAMPASRLGLPTPPGHQIGAFQQRKDTGGFHFGHTADPVYMGQCNTASSSCTFGGYAMQSVCHTGFKCAYDTVGDLGWRVGIGTHKIVSVIKDVLEAYDEVAKCEQYVNCTDCFPWEFFESNGTEPTTSKPSHTAPTTTSSFSRTRTETCKTPGWWGCLDESTTTSHHKTTTTTTTTSSSTTTTCKTPGWFGCKDEITTTTTSASTKHTHASLTPTQTQASSSPAPTTSCKTPGWFGCNDPLPTTTSTSTKKKAKRSSSPWTSDDSASTTCTEDFFGLFCLDNRAHTGSSLRTDAPSITTTSTV